MPELRSSLSSRKIKGRKKQELLPTLPPVATRKGHNFLGPPHPSTSTAFGGTVEGQGLGDSPPVLAVKGLLSPQGRNYSKPHLG